MAIKLNMRESEESRKRTEAELKVSDPTPERARAILEGKVDEDKVVKGLPDQVSEDVGKDADVK